MESSDSRLARLEERSIAAAADREELKEALLELQRQEASNALALGELRVVQATLTTGQDWMKESLGRIEIVVESLRPKRPRGGPISKGPLIGILAGLGALLGWVVDTFLRRNGDLTP